MKAYAICKDAEFMQPKGRELIKGIKFGPIETAYLYGQKPKATHKVKALTSRKNKLDVRMVELEGTPVCCMSVYDFLADGGKFRIDNSFCMLKSSYGYFTRDIQTAVYNPIDTWFEKSGVIERTPDILVAKLMFTKSFFEVTEKSIPRVYAARYYLSNSQIDAYINEAKDYLSGNAILEFFQL